MKSFLQSNDIEMYSANNEEKSAISEKIIRTLRTKFYKYMTSMSKNMYNHKLDDIVNKYNNTYHTTDKMKRVDVKSGTYTVSNKKVNNKDAEFKIGDIKIFFQKVILQICLKKFCD